MIADAPPGLVSREVVTLDEDFALIRETWDISVPGCPMVRSPWTEWDLFKTPTVWERRLLVSPLEAKQIARAP